MRNLGKYEIHEQLGKGGFGTVYRATDTTLGREVALKVLHSQLVVDDTFVKRFKKEARSLASLDNHHIVTIHEFGEIDGLVFIAMQFLPGGNLKQLIANNGCIPFNQALQIMRQIGDGLTEAHEKGLIHRDLKPENILFDSRGEAVITDFGLVKDVSGTTMYSQGEILGSPNYIAPEIWSGAPASSSSDLYAQGCILYEMLSGKVLFEGDSLPSIMKKHFEPLQLPNSWPADVPKGINSVLRKALAEKPESRYASVAELVNGLHKISTEKKKHDNIESPHKTTILANLDQEVTSYKEKKVLLKTGLFGGGLIVFLGLGIIVGTLLNKSVPILTTPTVLESPLSVTIETGISKEPTTVEMQKTQVLTSEPTVTQTPFIFSIPGKIDTKVKCRQGPSDLLYPYDVVLEPQDVQIVGRNVDGSWLFFQPSSQNNLCWTLKKQINYQDNDDMLSIVKDPEISGEIHYGYDYALCYTEWEGTNCKELPSCFRTFHHFDGSDYTESEIYSYLGKSGSNVISFNGFKFTTESQVNSNLGITSISYYLPINCPVSIKNGYYTLIK